MRKKTILASALAAIVAVACSNNGTSGSCTASPKACPDGCNPCSKLTDAQVAMVVGHPQVTGMWNSDACVWYFTDASNNPSFTVGFTINTDYQTFQLECHPKNPEGGIMVTPVSGVADDACYVATGGRSYTLDFLKGCDAYSIYIAGPGTQPPPFPDATTQMYSKSLAAFAAQNL